MDEETTHELLKWMGKQIQEGLKDEKQRYDKNMSMRYKNDQ